MNGEQWRRFGCPSPTVRVQFAAGTSDLIVSRAYMAAVNQLAGSTWTPWLAWTKDGCAVIEIERPGEGWEWLSIDGYSEQYAENGDD